MKKPKIKFDEIKVTKMKIEGVQCMKSEITAYIQIQFKIWGSTRIKTDASKNHFVSVSEVSYSQVSDSQVSVYVSFKQTLS